MNDMCTEANLSRHERELQTVVKISELVNQADDCLLQADKNGDLAPQLSDELGVPRNAILNALNDGVASGTLSYGVAPTTGPNDITKRISFIGAAASRKL